MSEPIRISFECLMNEQGEMLLFVPKDSWHLFAESEKSYIFIPQKGGNK